ncbi:MAG: flagellar basal body protein [Oscillospiraceae bacterium]|jgi:flagellar hook-associated protein 1 FlgK|nr:flagellar basal body protein [Oscillospiraceae bacterium]
MTRATFFGIEIGKTGLTLSQLGLDITGHNIANVDTAGYTRQRLVSTAYEPYANIGKLLPVSKAIVGGGVQVKIHDQIRSAYLDRRFRTEYTINSYLQKRVEGLSTLESYFDDVNEKTSINYSISTLFEAMKILADDTVEAAPRELLQDAGRILAQHMNTVYKGLIDIQDDYNLAVKTTVEKINLIAAEIVELNKSIYGFEVTGLVANDLRDKRNLLLDELSGIIEIRYEEYPDKTGMSRLRVEIGGEKGMNLVDHDKYNELDVVEMPNAIAGEDPVWMPVWAVQMTNDPQLYPGTSDCFVYIGESRKPLTLAGVNMSNPADVKLAVKTINDLMADFKTLNVKYDSANPANPFIGTAADVAQADSILATLKSYLGADAVAVDCDQGGGHAFISIKGEIFARSKNCIDSDKPTSEVQFWTNMLDVSGGELKSYMDIRDSLDVTLPGIPYYINLLNNLARALVQEINDVHVQGWNDMPAGSQNGILFFDDGDGGLNHTLTYDAAGDVIGWLITDMSLITAKNFRLSNEVEASKYNISCSSEQIDRTRPDGLRRGDNENMNALYDLFRKKDIVLKDMSTPVGGAVVGSLDGFATSIRFDIAKELHFIKSTAKNSDSLILAAENQRQAISGVSLDEEMTNLIKYQHAYSGASRVITAMDDALDKLINGTGRVGL